MEPSELPSHGSGLKSHSGLNFLCPTSSTFNLVVASNYRWWCNETRTAVCGCTVMQACVHFASVALCLDEMCACSFTELVPCNGLWLVILHDNLCLFIYCNFVMQDFSLGCGSSENCIFHFFVATIFFFSMKLIAWSWNLTMFFNNCNL